MGRGKEEAGERAGPPEILDPGALSIHRRAAVQLGYLRCRGSAGAVRGKQRKRVWVERGCRMESGGAAFRPYAPGR